MIFRVLGCSGSELDRHHPCSFQIGINVLVDMGSAASRLTIGEQAKVSDIFLSHAHLDHTKDITFFAENIFTLSQAPVNIRGTKDTLEKLKAHLLNDRLWPDFTILPNKTKPILQYVPFEVGTPFLVGELEVLGIPVTHPGGCVALFFKSQTGTLLYTGDTGPTEEVWKEVNRRNSDMKAILLETSFPNRLESVAEVSGHHTPSTLYQEMEKIRFKNVPIFVYHMKAPYQGEIVQELDALNDERIRLLEPGMKIEF